MSIASAPLLAIDAGSPLTSVAVGAGGDVLAAASSAEERSSTHLLRLVDGALREAGLGPRDLAAVIAARGPGSFTGLRVGLATALAMHQALGLRAGTVTTFAALAAAAPPGPCLAVVDALRGEWFSQRWEGARDDGRRSPGEEPALRDVAAIADLGPLTAVGFGLSALAGRGAAADELTLAPAPPLAAAILELAARGDVDWRPSLLVEPLYLRPPAALDRR